MCFLVLQRSSSTADMVMLERIFLADEKERLEEDKKIVVKDPGQ